MINITKKEFVKLAKENLIVLEDFQLNEAGFHDTNIYGVEQLYKAIKTYKPKP
jgi:hypothetical protein